MLGVPESGIRGTQQLYGPAGGILRGNQVDALLLPPHTVLGCPMEQIRCVGNPVAGAGSGSQMIQAVENGPGIGRGIHTHMVGGNHCLEPLTADVHFHLVVFQHVAVNVAQSDGPLGGFVQNDSLQAFPLGAVVRDHGAAGDPADLAVAPVDGHTGPHHAPVQQCDGLNAPGQVSHVGEVPIHDPAEGGILLLQGSPADVVSLLGSKADSKFGQGHSKDGHGSTLGVSTHFVTVQGQSGFQTQSVPGAQSCGLCAQLHQPVPQPRSVLATAVDLVAQRLAGVAGLGHLHLMTLEGQSVQGVLHRLRHLYPTGEGGQQILGLGALHGDGGPPGGDVRDGAVIVLHHGAQMHQILLCVGGVHHQQEPLLLEAVEIRIVHGPAVLVRQDAVLGHVQIQTRHVAG